MAPLPVAISPQSTEYYLGTNKKLDYYIRKGAFDGAFFLYVVESAELMPKKSNK